MADFTLNQLPPAQTPLLDGDKMIVSRNGTTLNQLTLLQLAQYVNTEADPGDVQVFLEDNTSDDLFVTFVSTTAGRQFVKSSTKFKFEPSTGTVIANNFAGSGASLSSLNASNISSGTLLVTRGGTGTTTAPTSGQLLVGNSSGSYSVTSAQAGNGIIINTNSGTIEITTNATHLNTENTLVKRNGSGNFSAGTITASLVGNVTGNLSGTATQADSVNLKANSQNIVRLTFADTFGDGSFIYTDSGLTYNKQTGVITTAAGAINRSPSIENNDMVVTNAPSNLNFAGDGFIVTAIGNDVTITNNKQFTFDTIRLKNANGEIGFIEAGKFDEELKIFQGDGITLEVSPIVMGELYSTEFKIINSDRGSIAVNEHEMAADPHPQYLLRSEFEGGGGNGSVTFIGNTGTVMGSSFNIFGENGISVFAETPNNLRISPLFGAPVTIMPDDANMEGIASSFARSDHQHEIMTLQPVELSHFLEEGISNAFARSDHVHAVPKFLKFGSPDISEVTPSYRYAAASMILDPRISFSRSTTATFRNKFGKHVSIVAEEPRFEFSAHNVGLLNGLLIEGTSTNFAFHSEEHGLYTKTGITAINTTDVMSPVESNKVISITQTAGTNSHELSRTLTDTDINNFGFVAVSCFVKSEDSNLVRFRCAGSSVIIDLNTLEVVNQSGTTFTDFKVSIENNGYYRIGAEFVRNGASALTFGISFVQSEMHLGNYDVLAADIISYDITGIQYEAYNEARRNYSSYIPTTTAKVMRAADMLIVSSSLAERLSDKFGFYIHTRATDSVTLNPKYSSGIRLLNPMAPTEILIEPYVHASLGTKITYGSDVYTFPLMNVLNPDLGGLLLKDIQTFITPLILSVNGVSAMPMNGSRFISSGDITITDLFSHLVELRVYGNIDDGILQAQVMELTNRGSV